MTEGAQLRDEQSQGVESRGRGLEGSLSRPRHRVGCSPLPRRTRSSSRTRTSSRCRASSPAIEDAIQNARRYYNAIIRDLNTGCDVFPSNIVANVFAISKGEYFELDSDEQREVPAVDFSS